MKETANRLMRIEVFTSGILKTNSYVVGADTSREVIVIDPAGKTRPIIEYINREKLEVSAIVNTHGHWDHISGNSALKAATGAPVCVHEMDGTKLGGISPWALLFRGRPRWSPPADRVLVEGDDVAAGNYRFEVIHTPGHSPGSICLKYKKFLFTGDTLFAGGVGRTKNGREGWKVISESIQKKLFILSDDIACYPGHGPRTTIERERKGNIFVRFSQEQIEQWLLQAPRRPKREVEKEGE